MSDELDIVRRLRLDDDMTNAIDMTRSALMELLTSTAQAIELLRSAHTVLLVDWHEDVPRTLIAAGYDVVSWHGTLTRGQLVDRAPATDDDTTVYPPRPGDDRGHLVWRPLVEPLEHVDLVCTFRPPEDHLDYLERFAIPLGATAFWIEAGNASHSIALGYEGAGDSNLSTSDDVRRRAAEAGIAIVEGLSLSETLRQQVHE